MGSTPQPSHFQVGSSEVELPSASESFSPPSLSSDLESALAISPSVVPHKARKGREVASAGLAAVVIELTQKVDFHPAQGSSCRECLPDELEGGDRLAAAAHGSHSSTGPQPETLQKNACAWMPTWCPSPPWRRWP
mmetsp:Transcript_155354/g.498428  ORF Transcript_155354/g.498428 Transcript_155354/m.498428 type:complete len:136 (+) Transcript_155354:331-738(+)